MKISKIKIYRLLVLVFFALNYLIGCAHGHCPNPEQAKNLKSNRVWVYKYDQSKQCDKRLGVSIESMLKDFKQMNVIVYESKKKYDGLTRIQACGAFTGLANLFYIQLEDLDKVSAMGYQRWDF